MSRFLLLSLTILSLLLPLCPSATAASFDCAAASTTIEKSICADSILSDLDSRVGQSYHYLRKNLPAKEAAALKRQQREWLAVRNKCSDDACLVKIYEEKLSRLRQIEQKNRYADQAVTIVAVNEQTYDNAAAIIMRFSVPLADVEQVRNRVRVEKDGKRQFPGAWLLSDDRLLAIYPFVEPQSQYKIKVLPGIKAVNGKAQIAKRSFSIKTRRTNPSAAFADNGMVMSASLKRALPVTTFNIDQVDVDIFRIAADSIQKWSRYSGNARRDYYDLSNFSEKNKLVYTGRFDIEHRRNQRTTSNLDLSSVEALNVDGAYLAVLRVAGQYEYEYDTSFFTVSDIGLQVRKNETSLNVLSHSLVSGTVLAGVEVSLYDEKELLAQAITDERGIAAFGSAYTKARTAIARRDGQLTVLRLQRPLDLSAIRNPVSRFQSNQVFAWGPRDLYRPGEEVVVDALLRDYDGRKLDTALALTVELIDGSGNSRYKGTLNADDKGVYQLRYRLSSTAHTGAWTLYFRIGKKGQVLHEYRFAVEDFLPERMTLKLFDGNHDSYRLIGATKVLNIPVEGNYLYGAVASGNSVDGFVVAELEPHPFEQWPGYYFGIADEKVQRQRLSLDEMALDQRGQGHWDLKLSPWKKVRSPLALTTTASLYESGGRPVTRSLSVTRTNQQQLIGIEPQFKDRADNDGHPQFKLILTDHLGKMDSGKGYQIDLIREDRNYYWTFSDSSGWVWHYDPMEYKAFSGNINFDGKIPTTVAVPVEWGNYRLEVKDSKNTLISSYRFRTRWYWYGNADQGTALKPDMVRMAFRDEVYHPGDIAHLQITPPTDGIATVTVETNEEILWFKQLAVKANGAAIDIPMAEDWDRHDIYVSVMVMTPGDMTHSVAPKRAFGFINLPVKRPLAEFDVAIDVAEKLEPNRQVLVDIKVDSAGKLSRDTFVTLAAVDVGVLNITRYKTPDAASYFYAPRRLATNFYDIYGRIIENAGFPYLQQRFGGDGFAKSAAELARGGKKPDGDVEIMSSFTAPVRVDADGRASIPVNLPDFNGKVRFMAMVYSDDAYGHAERETTVADKLVVQLSKPRFMADGDEAELTLEMSNRSGEEMSYDLTLVSGGGLKTQQWQQHFELLKDQRATMRVVTSSERLENGTLELSINGKTVTGHSISSRKNWMIGMRSAWPAVTRSEQVVIEAQQSWVPQLVVDDLDRDLITARLALSSQPQIDTAGHFSHLLRYPYGCTEQLVSTTWPWLLVDPQYAEKLGIKGIIEEKLKQPYTDGLRKEQIEKTVQKLLRSQTDRGGFGSWSGRSQEVPWLSAYVTDFLTEARLQGAAVSGDALNHAIDYLRAHLRKGGGHVSPWSDNPAFSQLSDVAYGAYVLAKIKRLNLSDLRRYYDGLEEVESLSPLPWVQLADAFETLGDKKRAADAWGRADKVSIDSSKSYGYYGNYGSYLRDQSLAYLLLERSGRPVGNRLMDIFKLSKDRRWLSTQERNVLFHAALVAAQHSGDALDAALVTDTFEQQLRGEESFTTLLDGDQLKSLKSVNALQGRVYATLEVSGQYQSSPPSYSHGMIIERELFGLDGKPLVSTVLKSGDLVIVRLSVQAERRTPDALVVDLLPAGLELENQNLSNAGVDLSKILVEGESIADWQQRAAIEHVEYRDDRFIAALQLDQNRQVAQLYYLARAVTPGTYLVPPPYVEDMYRPEYQALGDTATTLTVER